ncbi:MAG: hypothetical protein ABSD99_09465 [Candidatus Bathyarchaeia archaeon]
MPVALRIRRSMTLGMNPKPMQKAQNTAGSIGAAVKSQVGDPLYLTGVPRKPGPRVT